MKRSYAPAILLFVCGLGLNQGRAQYCFNVNSSLSSIHLEPGADKPLPNHRDTVLVPCTQSIANFNFFVEFMPGVEDYFESQGQLSGVLYYKSSTILLQYDKAENVFSLSGDQHLLQDGLYQLNISAINCAPPGLNCNNCSINYEFYLKYNTDVLILVDIKSAPTPAVLTCLSGSSVKLTATAPPTNAFSGQWAVLQNNQFVNMAGETDTTLIATQPGTYRFTLTGPAGCTGDNFIAVNPPQMPEIDFLTSPITLQACAQKVTGMSVRFGGPPGNVGYQWTALDNGLLLSGANSAEPTVGAPGRYVLSVTRSDNGCTDTDTLLVVPGIVPVIQTQISRAPASGPLDCRLKTIKLSAEATQSSGPSGFTFLWSDGSSGAELSVQQPGIYAVTATSTQSGCLGTSNILIMQDISAPFVQIISARDTLCAGQSLPLSANTQEPVVFEWSDGNTGNTTTVLPANDGDNAFTLTVTANDNGCTNTAFKSVFRIDPPALTCFPSAVTVQDGQQVNLGCTITGGQLFWLAEAVNVAGVPFSGVGQVVDQEVRLSNNQGPGTVRFSFYGQNSGCTSPKQEIMTIVLPADDAGLFIPELVTPNGDGLNDQWEILLPASISDPSAYTILLFNRFGAQVYEGNLGQSIPVETWPDGTYFYAVSIPDGRKVRGAVTILRRD